MASFGAIFALLAISCFIPFLIGFLMGNQLKTRKERSSKENGEAEH